jgi:hypothetical protein
MDVRQLRYVVGVLEAKSLNKASRLLHVAQPAAQIRKLERELGLELLHRHPRGVEPTEVGRAARGSRALWSGRGRHRARVKKALDRGRARTASHVGLERFPEAASLKDS